jgi:CheY-like chemotaxis protein
MDEIEGKVPQIEGNFTALSLVSLIQGISTNRKMLITLYSREGNEGRLFFEDSMIVGAFVGEELVGKKAFFRMIEWEDARFQAFDIDDIDEKFNNINVEVSHLLLEGLRQKDEKKKIKQDLLPVYKIKKAEGKFQLTEAEQELWDMILDEGSFISTLVNNTTMTDWEAYAVLAMLMKKKALVFMKLKVLVIDDSEFMTRIISDILEKLYRNLMIIKTLGNGEEAVQIIVKSDRKNRPDLIFTDIMMEGVGGMEVIKVAREQNPPIFTIAITSLQREMRDILEAGANYLHKNWITRDNIGEIMENLVERTVNGELSVIGGEGTDQLPNVD